MMVFLSQWTTLTKNVEQNEAKKVVPTIQIRSNSENISALAKMRSTKRSNIINFFWCNDLFLISLKTIGLNEKLIAGQNSCLS